MPVLSNARHERFAQEIAKGKTATEAYVEAGYKPNDGNASTLKGNQRILERVAEIVGQAAKKAGATVERTLEEMVRIGYADIGDAVKWESGKVVLENSTKLSPDVRAAVAEVKQTKDGVAIKFHSKPQALEMLGRALGIFKDKLEVEGSLDIADRILARRRELRRPIR